MFYILRTVDPPFASTPPEMLVVATFDRADSVAGVLQHARLAYPNDLLTVVETVIEVPSHQIRGQIPKMPNELARAVERWNEIAPRCVPPLQRVMQAERLIAPYRRWKRRATSRTMLLEEIVALVEPAVGFHEWITLSWLFGEKDGTLNYEKLLHRSGQRRTTTPGKRAAGSGDDFAGIER